jgi:dihydroorotase
LDRKPLSLAGSVVLRGGRVIDPLNGIDGPADVAFRDGKIVAVGPGLDTAGAQKIVDLSGLCVTPGLVDIHVHLYATAGVADAWAGDNSILPDGFSFRSGVTTMVDAGSAGWKNFNHFAATVIERAKTRVFAFLNIGSLGMMTEMAVQEASVFEAEKTAALAAAHPGLIVGIKTAHYRHPDWLSVDRALRAADLAGLPVMVDFGYFRKERPYWELVGTKLRKGDISTHCYRGTVPVVDRAGRVYDYLFKARERGVLFDVGHGGGSFVFRNVVPALAQGFGPDSISTDLHVLSMNVGMLDMPTTMTKFLALGMDLAEVVRHSTCVPAAMIGHPELGNLSPGGPADIAVWKVLEGRFGLADSSGGRIEADRRLFCELTFKDGRVAWDWNARTAADYRTLGDAYGIRDGKEFILTPET